MPEYFHWFVEMDVVKEQKSFVFIGFEEFIEFMLEFSIVVGIEHDKRGRKQSGVFPDIAEAVLDVGKIFRVAEFFAFH